MSRLRDAHAPLAALVVPLALVALLAAACGEPAAGTAHAGAGEAVPVSVAKAERRDLPLQVRAVGRAESPASVVVKPQVSGLVVEQAFQEGDHVEARQLLLRLDDRPFRAQVAAAEAALAGDEAMARDAALTLEQLERVEDLMSEREVQQARAGSEAAQADVLADRAALELARLRLEYSSIRAPLSGRAGALGVRVGSVVKAEETELVTINQMAPMRVAFSVPEQRLPEIRAAFAAGPLAVDARVEGRAAGTGTLSFIDNAVDPNTGTVRLHAEFANADLALWPGQFVEVLLTIAREDDVVVVPDAAVQAGQAGEFAWVVGADGTAEQRPVRVRRRAEGLCVVDEGLTGGETVVTEGHLRLLPGARVESAQP